MTAKTHHRGDFRCPVCGGADSDRRGQGRRCHGWTMTDGWTHCSRTPSRWPDKGGTWAHPPAGHRLPRELDPPPAKPRDEQAEERRRRALTRTRGETVALDHPAAKPARLYLASRGLAGASSPALRFHPALRYYDDEIKLLGTFPALIAVWQAPDGRPITLHRTYLTAEGRKAPVPTPRKMMSAAVAGTTSGGAIRLSAEPGARLAITEGIETALAFGCLTGWPVWSTYSTSGMKAVVLPASVIEVVIAADHDPDGQKAACVLARRLLAEGRKVKILTPPGFKTDWNDVLLQERSPA